MIFIHDARIVSGGRVEKGNALVEGKTILEAGAGVRRPEGARSIDAAGRYLTPGLIDLHLHGGGGHSALTADKRDIAEMARAHARFGTTSVLPTVMTAPLPQMIAAVRAVREAGTEEGCANLLGVHLEGPCLSYEQRGAQAPEALRQPGDEGLQALWDEWPEGARMVGIAPELPGALELGRRLAERGAVVSVAHSNATYDRVEKALEYGFSDVTHLYSCCSGLIRVNGYRVPGVIEAGLNLGGLTCQVIADGKHLPPALISLIYRCKGRDGMYLVTDALEFAAADVKEGMTYRQNNGVETVYEDGVMKLPDRKAFAGSTATMNRLVWVAVEAGIPVADAVYMATATPARRIGLEKKGAIASGMDADLAMFDDRFSPVWVMIGGTEMPVNENSPESGKK